MSDPFHIDNQTTCSAAFQSTMHSELRKLNKEVCEQFNSLLRSVQSSVSYMKFENYLQAIRIFIGFYNLRGMEKKINSYSYGRQVVSKIVTT